jgi:hypothetical protein
MFVLGIVVHCEIIVPGKVQDKICTTIPVNAFDNILQVGEIPNVHLCPADVFMFGYAGFLLRSSGQAKKPVPVGAFCSIKCFPIKPDAPVMIMPGSVSFMI